MSSKEATKRNNVGLAQNEEPSKRHKADSKASKRSQDESPEDKKPKTRDEMLKDLHFTDAHIKTLDDIQKKLEKTDQDLENELREIQIKYNKIKQPLYDQRQQTLSKVDNVWFQAFNQALRRANSGKLELVDLEIAKHLTSIDVANHPDGKGHTITLSFSDNKYFKNPKLTKEYKEISRKNEEKDEKDKDKDKDKDQAGDLDRDEEDAWKITTSVVQWTDANFPKENQTSFFVNWFSPWLSDEEGGAGAGASASASAAAANKPKDFFVQELTEDNFGEVIHDLWKNPLAILLQPDDEEEEPENDPDEGDADERDDLDGERNDADGEKD